MRNHLHALCPYFAMFPEEFVARYVEAYTKSDDYVFDPFCGRGTTILQSLLMNRNAAGTDINPVAYCVSSAKARAPSAASVMKRIDSLEHLCAHYDQEELMSERRALSPFFGHAYQRSTLISLLFLRTVLKWETDDVDRFIAALVLGSLHGEMDKSDAYFSNQMPRTISTKPEYSVRYWRSNRLCPPARDVFGLLRKRTMYRLSSEIPQRRGAVSMSDARDVADIFVGLHGRVRAIITSPPYLNVTRYEEDQWLRLWFLGHESKPTYSALSRDDRHSSHDNYWDFLSEAWEGMAPLLGRKAFLICRLAGTGISRKDLTENLHETILLTFPQAHLVCPPKISKIRNRQTTSFQPGAKGCFFEIDYEFRLT